MRERVSFTEQIRIALSKPLWYRSLFRQSIGQHIGYFIILMLLITVIQCVIPMVAYIESAGGLQQVIYEELPEFSVADGELYVSSVVDIENTGIRLIIDTSVNQFQTSDAERVASGMDDSMPMVYLVSSTNVVCNAASATWEFTDLNLQYNNDRLYQDAPVLLVGYMVLFVARTLAGYVISALFFSLFGLLVNKALHLKLKFRQIFFVALYAKSVEIILEAILEVLGISVLYYIGTIIGIFITCSYMTQGMGSLAVTAEDVFEDENDSI